MLKNIHVYEYSQIYRVPELWSYGVLQDSIKAPGFSKEVLPYQDSKVTWIRKEAKRYLEFDQTQNKPLLDNPWSVE